jgi:hypothetical protein
MITFVSAANKTFEKYLLKLTQDLKKLNYNYIIYNLGGLDFGIPFDGKVGKKSFHTIPCKPEIIENALNLVDENNFVVWLDADTIINSRIDEIIGEYDVGVTVRKIKNKETEDMPINAGVLFFRKNKNTMKFVNDWKQKSYKYGGDQIPLNELCNINLSDTNQIVLRDYLKIKAFPCDIYNNFYFAKDQSHAKIVHFKSKFRKNYPLITIK